ncbi:MAG TPA: sulfite exporter TauE/SafE family protein [Bacteroidales bacterium]|nr:sulfite exporter TauE/SafE family protein [Bacteroidales bacterium]
MYVCLMFIEGLTAWGLDAWMIVVILVASGFLVGLINTIAGSGTVISYSLFVALGMPAPLANGTVRLGVVMQTLTSTLAFYRNGKLDLRKGWLLGIPIVLGSVLGAQVAASINKDIFEIIVGVALLVLLVFIFVQPEKWIAGVREKQLRKVSFLQYFIFFAIGIYGGFLHIGVGIFLLTALVLNSGYDLVQANGLKVFLVLLYSPFALAVFLINGQVEFLLGSIVAVGNIFGGWAGSKIAIKKGAGFIRILLVIIIFIFSTYLLGLWSLVFKWLH